MKVSGEKCEKDDDAVFATESAHDAVAWPTCLACCSPATS